MDDSQEPWERASLLLEAHRKISKGEHHPLDVPSESIERLLTDLQHYCHERNKGTTVGSGEYLEFDQMVKFAREQFVREREATPELHEPLLDPSRPQPDLELEALQQKLYVRQLSEFNELEKRQQLETKDLGPSEQLDKQHRQERDDQTEKFEKERERYVSEYQDAKRIAQEMEQQEKQEALEPEQDHKLSR